MVRRPAFSARPIDGSPLTPVEVSKLTSIEVGLRRESPHLALEFTSRWRRLLLGPSRCVAGTLVMVGAVLIAAGLLSHIVVVSAVGFVGAVIGLHALSFRWSGRSIRNLCHYLGLERVDHRDR